MDILVGDETRSYFPVTIWQSQMGSQVFAGHVFLLQNLKITRFGDVVEARALHCSSLQCLLHPNDFASFKGLDELIAECRIGITARDKLQKVVGWLQRARLAHCGSLLNCHELYVWDDSEYLPLLVTNKAAELLFGNIPAEKVYSSYNSRQQAQRCCQNYTAFQNSHSSCATTKKMVNPESSSNGKSLQMKDKNPGDGNPNFYMIWLILLNMLFQHGKNSPMKFKVTVHTSRDWEGGRFEMESFSVPAFKRITAA
ncbi:hypothetical protein CDL12_28496 [Handroanthus impetiginosus]|uniref:Uncharacterized protein n=1 Tax=Handroanthus impetiginosus TaxID=429701 RepID=A0A2G9G129_9LAMI|nr:hypothetical protein CDL12_28496 [Handroanthus impetiginosus]